LPAVTAPPFGAQFGVIVGGQSDPLMIALDARYSPALFNKASELWGPSSVADVINHDVSWGLSISYYIPFVDLN
jgi:hypothetical protein